MIVDPWSVSPDTVDTLATQFFSASLLPYLAFLYFIGKESTNCPKLSNTGFRFLLVFVFVTIPAGIYAKVQYHEILANVDWLHGGAESLLTITNLLIVLGFRNVMTLPAASLSDDALETSDGASLRMGTPPLATALAMVTTFSMTTLGFLYAEPLNALSFPTWVIHLSSLIEWLVAMGLVWRYANVVNNQTWKGLTWGMLPLHTSGICACTYHFFYNDPSLNVLVAIQAALTCVGNATMAAAAYRISRSGGGMATEQGSSFGERKDVALLGFEDMGSRFADDSNLAFFLKIVSISFVTSALVKWGSLTTSAPFQPSLSLAAGIIAVPTLLNMAKWVIRSRTDNSNFSDFM